MGLVITGIHHSRAIDLQAITECKRRVIQIMGRDFDIFDGKSAQSMIRRVPRAERTSMQDVFPPYRAVLGPGLAIEPRVPLEMYAHLPSR